MEPCRLCMKIAQNPTFHLIFDDDSDTLLKILTCLPLRLSKGDGLPNKICSICFHKVNDFYCFRNKAVDSENSLNDLHGLQHNKGSQIQDKMESEPCKWIFDEGNTTLRLPLKHEPLVQITPPKHFNSVCTQTEDFPTLFKLTDIKEEIVESVMCGRDDYEELPMFKNEPLTDDSKDIVLNAEQIEFSNPENIICASVSYNFSNEYRKSKKSPKTKIKIKKHARKSSGDINSIDADNLIAKPDILQSEDAATDEIWMCCVCFKKFKKRGDILKHYKSHCNEAYNMQSISLVDGRRKEVFNCTVCNQTFDSKHAFKTHFAIHNNGKQYKCSLCEKTFKTPVEILKHGKKYHPDTTFSDDTDAMHPVASPELTTKRFICDLCDEKFVYMKYLMSHRNAVHPEARGHRLINRCMHCKSEFAHLNSLRRHLRSHTGEKNFLCYVCGKALSSREHLKFHMRIHTGFKPNVCKTCGKGFVKKCNLVLHERVHSGERPHICSHCGKAFSQRSTLVIHERYHSGSKPYVCSLCNKGFVAKGLLSMHLKSSCV
ncbi:uncharacterized protein LOC143913909 [Arctopsyche grandis]|uniref:uncharacterized protein LOC143913909 n=1 Tax=Arctopsyche grandis TaxID=121162 RepID=UPI00406D9E9C